MNNLKNILILTYWSYNDALIQTYTLPYVRLIRKQLANNQKIFLVCLEQEKSRMNAAELKQEKERLKQENIHLLTFTYSNFGLWMMLKFSFIFLRLVFLVLFNNISHIHTWCTPAGAMGYILSVLTRKKLVLDSYEPHAEPMVESSTWTKESLKFKLLFWLEKKQLQGAQKVITCVESMDVYVKKRFNIELKNHFTKPACVNFDLFNANETRNKELVSKYQLENKTIGIYAGKFEGSYLKDEVFELIKTAEEFWGKDHFRFIILSSHEKAFIQQLVKKFDIASTTVLHLFVPHHQVPAYMQLADFGISPFIPVPSKRYGSPIKNSEYMAMGLPTIITKAISDDSEIIDKNNFGYVLNELSNKEYQKACGHINTLIKNAAIKQKIVDFALENRNFELAEKVYQQLYGSAIHHKINANKNVLVLSYWSYKDALIQSYTLPYVKKIRANLHPNKKIYLLTIEQQFFKMNTHEWEKEKAKLLQENIHLIRFRYSNFGIKMLLRIGAMTTYLTGLIWTKKIGVIHAWCTPAGSLGYILSKISGKPLIVDSFEPHAEAMVENGTWNRNSLKFKILFELEKKQSKHAAIIIALTAKMKDYVFDKYQTELVQYFVKPALVNLDKFKWNKEQYISQRANRGLSDKVVGIYTGKMGGIYLHEEFFDFFKVADDYWENKFHLLLLTDKNKDEIKEQIAKKGIVKSKIEASFVNYSEINEYLQLADFAINFVNPVPSKRYCTSIKDGECWAMGLPIVITKNISDDSDIIQQNNIGSVLNELNDAAYLKAIKEIDELLSNNSREEIYQKIRPIAEKYRNFEIAEKIYAAIYGN